MSIQTLSELFLGVADREQPDCLLHKVDGRYVPFSSAELADRVRRLHQALLGFGIQAGDRVALMAENGVHWPTVDFATLTMGGVVVPVYPTLTAEQAAYVIRDSGARVLFVQGSERLAALLALESELPALERWVLIGGDGTHKGIETIDGLIAASAPPSASSFEERSRRVRPGDVATLIYTSGTTGNPKGVILSHRNIVSNLLAALEVMDIASGQTALSFLPLSHSFERMVDYIYFHRGVTIAYAESVQAVAENLGEVRPHLFVSVPRVYEKVLAKAQETVLEGAPLKRRIFNWAVDVGRRALPWRLSAERPPRLLGLELALADRLVFSKIRQRLGGRFEFAISGGAPLSREVAEFFWGAGIRIYEGYGLSETSPVLSVNTREHVKLGTVGRPIPGVEIAIAEDGEILARGPNIMQGYFNLPQETAEAIDAEGWFHTGDIGEIDGAGFLNITDRKKEMIVNAYGKNVAPAPIENALKGSRFIGQAVVIGDRRKFLSALLVPDFEALAAWARRSGLPAGAPSELISHPRVRELLAGEVAAVNKGLARYEQVRAWELLADEFTIETGELTPTQKVKRRVVHQKYGARIEAMYATVHE